MTLILDHLAFPSSDPEATVRFYTDVLGFSISWALGSERRLTIALAVGGGPAIAFTCGDGVPPLPAVVPRGDAAHVGMVVKDVAERERWKQRLAAHGVGFTIEDAGSEERIYFADPNGVV